MNERFRPLPQSIALTIIAALSFADIAFAAPAVVPSGQVKASETLGVNPGLERASEAARGVKFQEVDAARTRKDKKGNVLHEKFVNGKYLVVKKTFKKGNVFREWVYSSTGLLLTFTQQNQSTRVDHAYHYNKAGELTGRTILHQKGSRMTKILVQNFVNKKWTLKSQILADGRYYEYNDRGQLSQYVDAKGNLFNYQYTYYGAGLSAGKTMEKAVYKNGKRVNHFLYEYHFDADHKLIGHTVTSRGWSDTYFTKNKVHIRKNLKDGRAWTYEKNKLVSYRDRQGLLTRYTYEIHRAGNLIITTRTGVREDGEVFVRVTTRFLRALRQNIAPKLSKEAVKTGKKFVNSRLSVTTAKSKKGNLTLTFENGRIRKLAVHNKKTGLKKAAAFNALGTLKVLTIAAKAKAAAIVIVRGVSGQLVRTVASK